MKIISIHVENFGKLHDFDRDFTAGLNLITEDNGYGKSTLAAFIRVMLYGFEGEGKRDELGNERKFYKPWQGGVYGGRIILETGERRLIIERTFGTKAAEDFIDIRDADTLLAIDGYGNEPGISIFKLDSASFLRSIMISQNECETYATDGINAKIGNTTIETDDINNFDKADKYLKGLIDSMTDKRKTGSRSKLASEIFELKHTIEKNNNAISNIPQLLDNIQAESDRIAEANDNIQKIEELKLRDAQNKSNYELRAGYERERTEYEQQRESWNREYAEQYVKLKNGFAGGLPGKDYFDEINELAGKLSECERRSDIPRLSVAEEAEFEELSKKYGLPEDNGETLFRALDDDIAEGYALNDKLRLLADESEDYKDKAIFIKGRIDKSATLKLLIGIIVLLGGVGLVVFGFAAKKTIYEIIGAVASAVGLLLLVFGMSSKHKNALAVAEADECERISNKAQQTFNDTNSRLSEILKKYGCRVLNDNAYPELSRIQNECNTYRRLLRIVKNDNLSSAANERHELLQKIDNMLAPYAAIISGAGYSEKIFALAAAKNQYELISEKKSLVDNRKSRLDEFEMREDFGAVMSAPELLADALSDNMNNEIDKHKMIIDAATENRSLYKNQLEELRQLSDDNEDNRQKLSELEEELKDQNERSKCYELTREFLSKARTSFSDRYRVPVTNNFKKYYNMLDGSEAENYSFDANTNLVIHEGGAYRRQESFSRGMRDLLGVAARMALTDAMFEEEKPYLVMDDPFVNLDDGRMKGAMKLLMNISKEYQVLYFTCSSTRIPV